MEKAQKQKFNAIWKAISELKFGSQREFSSLKSDLGKLQRAHTSTDGMAKFAYAYVAKANADDRFPLPVGYDRQQKKQARPTMNVFEFREDSNYSVFH
jgi:hypothetical protein